MVNWMPSDNVDIFKKIIFRIPSAGKIAPAIALLGLFYSSVFYLALRLFAGNIVDLAVLDPVFFLLSWLLIFLLPGMISGELLHFSIPDYPRKWGYFLAACNQLILFVYLLIFSGANNIVNAWNVIWLATTTLFLSNFFVLLLTLGYDYVKRIGVLATVHPVMVLASFHLLLGNYLVIPVKVYLFNLAIIFFAGIVLLAAFGAAEYLLRANVGSVSVLKLTSALLQKKQEELDLGYPARPEVQTLKIENETGSAEISVPWIHPGPLEGFGGGKITSDIIEKLNQDGEEGFFLHVPSTHKSDPTDPDDYRKIINAMQEPEKHSQASRLVKQDYRYGTFYGRRINGKNLVFMDLKYDDAELPIFREIIDHDETVLVDLHKHERQQSASNREELWYNTEDAEQVREELLSFLDKLREQPLHSYSAGFSVSLDGTPNLAVVENTDGQETLLFGIEGNEASPELLELEERYREEFDQVLLFTTDTHQSIHDLSSERQVNPDQVIENVENAEGNVSEAVIGFASNKAEPMNLLQEDYHSLIFSINILVRLIPLTLLLLYLGLVVWLL